MIIRQVFRQCASTGTTMLIEAASAFVAYGASFAALLGLPEKVTAITPLKQQIPERYCPLFAQGCVNALTKQAPARLNGAFENDFTAELFRAVFLPIELHPRWSKWLIFELERAEAYNTGSGSVCC